MFYELVGILLLGRDARQKYARQKYSRDRTIYSQIKVRATLNLLGN